jgi:plastocyanin
VGVVGIALMKARSLRRTTVAVLLASGLLVSACGGSDPAAPAYTVSGLVSGLSGTGLVLQKNGGDNLALGANGVFTFATPMASGATYAVTVLTQPTSPSQVCTVANATGAVGGASVVNVNVNCVTSTFTVGGTVSGLVGAGLVLLNNGGNNLAVTADGVFTFSSPLASGAAYAVTVLSTLVDPQQTCTVSNGTGIVSSANISGVAVACAAAPPPVCSAATAVAATSVTIQGAAFSPNCIKVAAGATVTFTNNDNVAHTVTADDGTYDGALATTGVTKVFTHLFPTAGTSNYHCSIHYGMKGTVIVQ